MPADGLCLYHCMTYGISNGRGYQSRNYAERFQRKVWMKLLEAGQRTSWERLHRDGPEGYPDEEDFPYVAAAAGLCFRVVQEGIRLRMVYGDGPVKLILRRHYIKDGAGEEQPHYDVVARDDVLYPSYEEIGLLELDLYTPDLVQWISEDPTIGNTTLIGKLEDLYAVSPKGSVMNHWRNNRKNMLVVEPVAIGGSTGESAMDEGAPSQNVAITEPPIMSIDDTCATAAAIAIVVNGSTVEDPIVVDSIDATLDSGDAAIPTDSSGAVTSSGGAIAAEGAISALVEGISAADETIVATEESAGSASADDGPIPQGATTRKRPSYGPEVNPNAAFNLAGPIEKTSNLAGSIEKAGGAKGKKKKESIVETTADPLPSVKPKDYDSFLQGQLNMQPTIKPVKLIRALEGAMQVTCNEQSMRTWLDKHEPVVAEPVIED